MGIKFEKYVEIIPDRWYILITMEQEKSNKNTLDIEAQIKDLRKNNGLTQIEFAKRAGVGLRFIRELEQGKTTVRMDKLMKVLDFLGYHMELKKNNAMQFIIKHSKTDLM